MKSVLFVLLALGLPVMGEVRIAEFRNGELAISNTAPGNRVFYSLEWRANLDASASWNDSWDGFKEIGSTNANLTVPVPMFFRVAAFPDDSSTNDLAGMYSNAVVDASNAVPAKISHHLTPLSLSNTNLSWRTNTDGGLQVKVCGFMASSTAARFYPVGTVFVNYGDLWITPYPLLRDFCQNYHGSDPLLRVKQLLGLPPTSTSDTVVEFWVSPDVIFRPTPEPDITSVSAGVLSSAASPYFASNTRVNPNWAEWYNTTYDSRNYGMTNGVYNGRPWTRLGYTYDWASTRPNHEGLSEYVIPAGMLWGKQNVWIYINVERLVPAVSYGSVNQ